MTPAQYPEQRFRHSQRELGWKDKRLGNRSTATMGEFGCVVTCTAYLLSRFQGHDVTPGQWLKWLTDTDHAPAWSFTEDGRLYWTAVDRNTSDILRYTTNRWDRTYTLKNVLFSRYSHWVVELRGGLCFDPWDAQIKFWDEMIRLKLWVDTGRRRYFKAHRKPAT